MHAPSSPIEPTASLPASAGDVGAREVDAREVDAVGHDLGTVPHDDMDDIVEVDEVELDGVVAVEALGRWLEARSMHPAFATRR